MIFVFFSLSVPGINGENADSIYAYDCAGGLLCTDNIQNTTAVR